MSREARRWRDRGFVLLLLAALSALFPTLVFSGHVLFERDLHQMLYGQYAALARMVASRCLPVWDPWPGFGQPMLANPAAQVLYPPTWLCLFLEPGRAYTAYVFLHLVGGALATRALARRLGVSTLASTAAALLWMLSGPILSLVNLWHHLAGAALMPLVWLAAEAVLREPTPRRAVLWGGAMGLQVLAGSFDMCLLTAGLTGAWWVYDRTRSVGRTPVGQLAVPLAVAGCVAATLASGLLVPALDVVRGSARAGLGESMRAAWSLRPVLLLQAILPLLPQSLPLPPQSRQELFDGPEPFLASIYLGLVAAPLVTAALSKPPRRPALFLGLAFAAAALLALGRHGLAYPALVTVFPPLQSLRYPVKVTVAMALPWSLLAGLGLDRLREIGGGGRRHWPALAAGTAAALAAAVGASLHLSPPGWLVSPAASASSYGAIELAPSSLRLFAAAGLGLAAVALIVLRDVPPAARTVGLVGLCGLDLGLAHGSLHATAPAELFREPPKVVSHLPHEAFVRIHAWDYAARVVGKPYRRAEPVIPLPSAPPEVPRPLAVALARQDFLSPPAAERFAIHGGFDRDWLGLQPRGVRNLSLVFQAREETPVLLSLLRLGAVSYTVSLHREGLEELVPVATEMSPFAGPVHLLRVPEPLPRAYAVSGVRVADAGAALDLLLAPDFDPSREVILPEGPPEPPAASFQSEVRITEARADRLRIAARLSAPGHVVVADAWDAGWRAFVDGRGARVLRANVGFRAVRMAAGDHELELVYRPRGLVLALAASASSGLLVLAALVGGWSRSPEPLE